MALTTLLESDLAETVSLDGEWRFRLADQAERVVMVPGAWEAQIEDRITDGPARYSRTFHLPHLAARIVLHCEAVAFACEVWVNGHWLGAHTGMWSPFQLDVTDVVQTGQNEILIEVYKPGVRHPLRQTLAGFLPDVANTFGGIWQPISLRLFNEAALSDIRLIANGGQIHLSGQAHVLSDALSPSACRVRVAVKDEAQNILSDTGETSFEPNGAFTLEQALADFVSWQTESPVRYSLSCELFVGARVIARASRQFGFRDISTQGDRIMLAGQSQSLRGVLSWGWDAKTYCPTPSAERVRADFAKARSMGFNLFKLCLYVPNETLFEIADQEGMLLWLELPLWLPEMSDALRELTRREYEGILRRVHHHPSIVIVSLGCELDRQADADFLAQLNALRQGWIPNALHCDNSGSAEAYGGVVTESSDFYDYHFYCELHYFQSLIDHFRRAYQPNKPWIFGEFSDADTLRDLARLYVDSEHVPWWLIGPFTFQRDELGWIRESQARLAMAGIEDGGAALTQVARLQAQAVRKFIFERVRLNFPYGGYVVTGWQDTPIASSGMLDDWGEPKFDTQAWQAFNSDYALALVRGRRRAWVHGGDRPQQRDLYVFWSDEPVDLSLVIVAGPTQPDLRIVLMVNDVESIGNVSLAPGVNILKGRLYIQNNCLCESSWQVIAIPEQQRNHVLARAAKDVQHNINAELMARVWAGHSQVLWLKDDEGAQATSFTQHMPFWRESIHVFAQTHPFWTTIPHEGYADARFYSVATDLAISISHLRDWLIQYCLCEESALHIEPIWRRFDARAMTWAEYVLEVRYGQGRVLISTLRFAGGLGQQPDSLKTNPMGCALLYRMMQLCEQNPENTERS